MELSDFVKLDTLIAGGMADSIENVTKALLDGKTIVIPGFGEITLSWRYSRSASMQEAKITPKIVARMENWLVEEARSAIKVRNAQDAYES